MLRVRVRVRVNVLSLGTLGEGYQRESKLRAITVFFSTSFK